MSHLDESVLHALLDGELDDAGLRQAHAHLGRCPVCENHLDEVKTIRSEADRLISSLGTPDVNTAATIPPLPEASPNPVLLIPDLPEAVLARQRQLRILRWAATLIVIAGAAYLALDARREARLAALAGPRVERAWTPAAASRADSGVLSQEEAPAARDMVMAPDAESLAAPIEPSQQAELERVAQPPSTSGAATSQSPDRREVDRLTSERRAAEQRAAEAEQRAAAAEQRAAEQRAADQRAADQRAAEQRAARAAQPSTIEERAQVFSRIGLDEAVRHLGGPMHVIEGMSWSIVGLASGRISPGMDPTRPVVRVVYLDAANRLILLDQQRLRVGQAPGVSSATRRVIDEVVVQIHGEPNAAALGNLAARIR